MNVLATNIRRITVMEPEYDPVLIVDSDAPVARSCIFEFLKLVPRTLQVIQTDSSVENI